MYLFRNNVVYRLGHPIAAGLTFTMPSEEEKDTLAYKEVQPWKELLVKGTFSEETLKSLPLSYM